jgi:hypothetical protein
MPDNVVDTAQSETLFEKLNSSIATIEGDPVKETPAITDTEAPEEVREEPEAGDDVEPTDEEAQPEAAVEKEDELDAQFLDAVKKFGVNIDAADVPESARPAFLEKLKHQERAWTKAVQEQRAYRTEKASFEAERQRYEKEFDKIAVDRILKDPSIIERINQELKKREDPVYAEAIELRRDADRMKAEQAVLQSQQEDAAREARGEALTSYTMGAAKTAGIPFKLVEEAVAYAILSARHEGREPTEADIDAVVADKAKVYSQHVAAVRGAKTREIVKGKVADRDAAKRKGTTTGNNTAGMSPPTIDLSKLSPSDRLRARIEASLDSYAA